MPKSAEPVRQLEVYSGDANRDGADAASGVADPARQATA